MTSRLNILSLLAAALLVMGCAESRKLMPTPNLYVADGTKLYGELPAEFTFTKVELLYVTDRVPEKDADGNLHYG